MNFISLLICILATFCLLGCNSSTNPIPDDSNYPVIDSISKYYNIDSSITIYGKNFNAQIFKYNTNSPVKIMVNGVELLESYFDSNKITIYPNHYDNFFNIT